MQCGRLKVAGDLQTRTPLPRSFLFDLCRYSSIKVVSSSRIEIRNILLFFNGGKLTPICGKKQVSVKW